MRGRHDHAGRLPPAIPRPHLRFGVCAGHRRVDHFMQATSGPGSVLETLMLRLRPLLSLISVGFAMIAFPTAVARSAEPHLLSSCSHCWPLSSVNPNSLMAPDGGLAVLTLGPSMEQTLAEAVIQNEQESYLALEPRLAQKVVEAVAKGV